MICPSCGADNDEGAAICRVCNYRFRFGHALGDPAKAFFPRMPTEGGRSLRWPIYLFLLLFLATIVIAIVQGLQ